MNNVRRESAEQRNSRLSVPVTEPFASTLARAARAVDRSAASYVRLAVLSALRADGYDVSEQVR